MGGRIAPAAFLDDTRQELGSAEQALLRSHATSATDKGWNARLYRLPRSENPFLWYRYNSRRDWFDGWADANAMLMQGTIDDSLIKQAAGL
ncbi:MAG: hypothetical protein WDN02_06765 [Methylovirgula sp.]|uniref:hypothetical protein n=1 Tax=Methylovirgula sp. TaxID=1978224 RepID=UPI0030760CB3